MNARRVSLVAFVVELVLLALPGTALYVISALSLSTLLNDYGMLFDAPGGSGGGGPPVTPLLVFGAFGLAFTSFWLLAWRFVAGGGDGVRRVSVIVWTLALAGQAVALGSVVASLAVDHMIVFALAGLTYPALGLTIPTAHMFVAAWRSGRGAAPAVAVS